MDRNVGLVLDPVFLEHRTGGGHPECPERLEALQAGFEGRGLTGRCRRLEPADAEDRDLARVHDRRYLAQVAAACSSGASALDADTAVCDASPRVARLATGSLLALAQQVAGGELDAGFAAVRPPGHHAERDRAMGFCLYNNAAVAAAALLERDAVNRVLIVDWDVHHGNGTQHIFESDDRVMYFSVHQSPLYPGTGAAEEIGTGPGEGFTVNRPLPAGAGDGAFLDALQDGLVPAADRFAPDFVLVSAGFDAHERDPLAGLAVTTAGFTEATGIVLDLADRHCGGKLVSVLEGGYDLAAMPASAAAHVETLLRP